jgi:hypothetical protein
MFELFLTAVVSEKDVNRARAVINGITGKHPQHTFKRIMIYVSPERGTGLATIKGLQKDRITGKAWFELHRILEKQSYFVHASYVVDENALKTGTQSVGPLSQNPRPPIDGRGVR